MCLKVKGQYFSNNDQLTMHKSRFMAKIGQHYIDCNAKSNILNIGKVNEITRSSSQARVQI